MATLRVFHLDTASDLPNAIRAELQAACADFGVLPDCAFGDIKLIVSDMDSTLITIECIDENRRRKLG